MSTAFNVNWSDVVIVLGTIGVSALTLMLIFNAVVALDAWSKQLGTRLSTRASRETLRREMQSKERVQDLLEKLAFSKEDNPNFGWRDWFLERSFYWLP